MKKTLIAILPNFLPIALAVTLLCITFYAAIQQSYRMSANDPQIQLAEDISTQLDNGTPYQYFVPNLKIDISKSLGTFLFIFDKNGKELAGSALLNGKQPAVPNGVFSDTAKKTETRFTWAPQQNVRIALVVRKYKNGFVAVGKSLREVESRVDSLGRIILLGWLITILSTLALMVVKKKHS